MTRKEYLRQYREDNQKRISKQNKKYYQDNKKRIDARIKLYEQNNKEQKILRRAKKRAIADNIPFDIDVTDIVIPSHCPILQIPLVKSSKHASDNSPSLDKIIPSFGYVKGNVQIISNKANRLKSNASLEDLVQLGNWAKRHLEV